MSLSTETVTKLAATTADQAKKSARVGGLASGRIERANTDNALVTQLAQAAPIGAALPFQLGPWQTGPIAFPDPTPVGGFMGLNVLQNGDFTFNGHFHVSGAPSYNVEGVWLLVSNSGKAFSFSARGHLAGTFESGSRDYDFAQNGNNPALRAAYAELAAGWHWSWTSRVNWDVQSAVESLVNGLKDVVAVAGPVIAVVALL